MKKPTKLISKIVAAGIAITVAGAVQAASSSTGESARNVPPGEPYAVRLPSGLCEFEPRLPPNLLTLISQRRDYRRLVLYMLENCPDLGLPLADTVTATIPGGSDGGSEGGSDGPSDGPGDSTDGPGDGTDGPGDGTDGPGDGTDGPGDGTDGSGNNPRGSSGNGTDGSDGSGEGTDGSDDGSDQSGDGTGGSGSEGGNSEPRC